MSNNLLDKFEMRAEKGVRRSHRKQAGLAGHRLDHCRSPFSLSLPKIDLTANVQKQAKQFGIHRQDRTRLRCLNALFDGR